MAYGLPSPEILEKYLRRQEENLVAGIRRKFAPDSISNQGFSYIIADAEFLKKYWRVYMHSEEREVKPSLKLAAHHFFVLHGFAFWDLRRGRVHEIADRLSSQLNKDNYNQLTIDEYKFFARFKVTYEDRRKLRDNLNGLTKKVWTAGSR